MWPVSLFILSKNVFVHTCFSHKLNTALATSLNMLTQLGQFMRNLQPCLQFNTNKNAVDSETRPLNTGLESGLKTKTDVE